MRCFRQMVLDVLQGWHPQGLQSQDILLGLMEMFKWDFGLGSRNLGRLSLALFCGTVHYCAPEIFWGEECKGPAVDISGLQLSCTPCSQRPSHLVQMPF